MRVGFHFGEAWFLNVNALFRLEGATLVCFFFCCLRLSTLLIRFHKGRDAILFFFGVHLFQVYEVSLSLNAFVYIATVSPSLAVNP